MKTYLVWDYLNEHEEDGIEYEAPTPALAGEAYVFDRELEEDTEVMVKDGEGNTFLVFVECDMVPAYFSYAVSEKK